MSTHVCALPSGGPCAPSGGRWIVEATAADGRAHRSAIVCDHHVTNGLRWCGTVAEPTVREIPDYAPDLQQLDLFGT